MHVVGHQHVGENGAAKAPRLLGEIIEIAPVVFFGMEANGAVVAALNDVPGNAGDAQACAAGHTGTAEFSFIRPS